MMGDEMRQSSITISRNVLLGIAGLVTIAADDPVQAPAFAAGDTWIFDQTVERGTQGFDQRRLDLKIERSDADTILVGLKRDGAPGNYEDHLVGSDWSIRRVLNGQDAPTARPFAFPLTVGQTWTVDFTDPTVRGSQTSLHVHRTYKAVGWQDVTVAAGTFHAIKVESSGIDQGTFAVPNAVAGSAVSSAEGGATVTRSQRGGLRLLTTKYHSDMYYVPTVKNYVKSVEEQYSTDDVLVSRQTRALVSFHPGA